tara:strand:+ start:39740 stop:40132 length:393 start_codon:yes stop_codon:yes gene_type:complete
MAWRKPCQGQLPDNCETGVTTMDDSTPHDPLDQLPDDVAADAFRRLVRHLQHRHDAQNIDLMGLAGFCRNCLADWIRDAGYPGDKAQARELIHGMPMDEWKATRQTPASGEQIARMEDSVAKNQVRSALP